MPLLKLHVSVPVPDAKRAELLPALSKLTGDAIGKPEQYVMAVIEDAAILMSGKPGPAAFADVRSIGGLNSKVNRDLSQKLCILLNQSLGIPANRVYVNFTDVDAANWGWNGSTFG